MALRYKSLQGTRDILPGQSEKWRYVTRVALETAAACGFGEIRIPTIERTELFNRSVGETTDVVQKEMYSFVKGDEHISLRPEGTAGTVRAVIENNLLEGPHPVKLCYILSCFRHDRPQAGRYREFHQFGIECLGSASPTADAEVIGVAWGLLNRLGVKNLCLEINSIGCPDCRPCYNEALKAYYEGHRERLCKTCNERLEKNPLRLLDCKEEACRALAETAPRITEYLCNDCGEHFKGLKTRLSAMGLAFSVNPFIVRGLDYYTKTVFEFISADIGAQATVCGGGRYDGLVGELGGPSTPALGFGLGLDRLILVMEAIGCPFPELPSCDLYIGSMGEEANVKALTLATGLRREGLFVLCDTESRSVKAQMRYADKMGAAYSCILGTQELFDGKARIKRMSDGGQTELKLDCEAFRAYLCGEKENPA
ncbi:MAG: histidine--tRNA ligase [Oscillospiraceae bacterium]|jgi:histidyl-tRNA synthetase|nr:histidine--tRNA ligase [Oscillospiraceae bacterium]